MWPPVKSPRGCLFAFLSLPFHSSENAFLTFGRAPRRLRGAAHAVSDSLEKISLFLYAPCAQCTIRYFFLGLRHFDFHCRAIKNSRASPGSRQAVPLSFYLFRDNSIRSVTTAQGDMAVFPLPRATARSEVFLPLPQGPSAPVPF